MNLAKLDSMNRQQRLETYGLALNFSAWSQVAGLLHRLGVRNDFAVKTANEFRQRILQVLT